MGSSGSDPLLPFPHYSICQIHTFKKNTGVQSRDLSITHQSPTK